MKLNISLDFEITDEMIDDLMCAAFEDFGYCLSQWCDAYFPTNSGEQLTRDERERKGIQYGHDALTKGCDITLHDAEDDKWYTFTLNDFVQKGIAQWCKQKGVTPDSLHDNHDAVDGDCLVQLAIFGDVVYG